MASQKALVLRFVREYIHEWHISPSYGEVAAATGITRQHAQALIRQLADEALLMRVPGKHRSLEMPDRFADAVRLLKAQGVHVAVDGAGFVDLAVPVTNPSLPMLDALDHIPDVELGGGQDGSIESG